MITVRPATRADWPAINALRLANALPVAGYEDSVSASVVACNGDTVVGAAALELYAEGALLRSVVVAASARGLGVGQAVTRAALDTAQAHGVTDVFLLTTTADTFFPRFGFTRIDRSSVPASVQQSVEFRGACPASAVAMRVRIAGRGNFATHSK